MLPVCHATHSPFSPLIYQLCGAALDFRWFIITYLSSIASPWDCNVIWTCKPPCSESMSIHSHHYNYRLEEREREREKKKTSEPEVKQKEKEIKGDGSSARRCWWWTSTTPSAGCVAVALTTMTASSKNGANRKKISNTFCIKKISTHRRNPGAQTYRRLFIRTASERPHTVPSMSSLFIAHNVLCSDKQLYKS